MSKAPTEARAAVPIEDQIAEVEREIRQRDRLYPEWIKAGRIKGDTANRKLSELRAAARSLRWLADNRDWIHAAHAERRERQHWAHEQDERAIDDPAVRAVQAAFPGAEIVAVRRTEAA